MHISFSTRDRRFKGKTKYPHKNKKDISPTHPNLLWCAHFVVFHSYTFHPLLNFSSSSFHAHSLCIYVVILVYLSCMDDLYLLTKFHILIVL
jgi:hypothetical protein